MNFIHFALLASLSVAMYATSPIASSQTKDNETAGQASAADTKPSKQERAAARKARRAAATKANRESIKGNNSTGAGDKPGQVK